MARNRAFMVSLAISTVFHLSMVTVFSIVFLYPRHDIEYYRFVIRQQMEASADATHEEPSAEPVSRDPLKITGKDLLPLDDEPPRLGALPAIELPRLEFAELELLQVREQSLHTRSRLAQVLAPPLMDSWDRIKDALSPTRLLEMGALFQDEHKEPETPALVTRPAEGFKAYIEWISEPKQRKLLFSPPINALWGMDPARLTEPLVLSFRVNPKGEVTEVLTPLADDEGVMVSAAKALTKYRFEPLEDANARDQHGTLLISAARPGEDSP